MYPEAVWLWNTIMIQVVAHILDIHMALNGDWSLGQQYRPWLQFGHIQSMTPNGSICLSGQFEPDSSKIL